MKEKGTLLKKKKSTTEKQGEDIKKEQENM